jgi:hypothetical protein
MDSVVAPAVGLQIACDPDYIYTARTLAHHDACRKVRAGEVHIRTDCYIVGIRFGRQL